MSATNCFWTKMFMAIPNRDERADQVGDRAVEDLQPYREVSPYRYL